LAQFEQFEAERFDLPEHAEHSRAAREQAVENAAKGPEPFAS